MKKIILIISIILIAFIISFYTSKENSDQFVFSRNTILKYVDGSFYFATLPGMENLSIGWTFRYSPADGEAKYFHNVEIYTSLIGTILVTNPTDLATKLKPENFTHKKNQIQNIDPKLLIGIWAENENENALFYLTSDSIYYTDHQDHPYAYKVNKDTLIMFGDIIVRWKIQKLSNDSLYIFDEFSDEKTKLYKR